ncbi:disease resistance protein RGA2-like [Syzygium oleosum]|uniref:disease resistance protein RGA2-like n=1 Tax=Syzygium oleosum TaxID=219896 RepID=UPI0024B95163|nr:disease resistance protein RGA2-like [Syzygium oleosum]
MAESLLFSIAESVLGKIASPALQEAVAIYNVENQICKLRETLTGIKAVLSDAEVQKATNDCLQEWLDRLQHVFYDVEDLFDEIECEALRKKVISRYGGVKWKVRRFFSLSNPLMFRAKICHKIKEIRQRLSVISTDKDQFNLNVRNADNGVGHTRSREITHSFINQFNVVGREIDRRQIIEMLVRPDDKNLSVIPIVGIGGLGKTTLAKLVYNDDGVKEQFELQLWVCVPEDFDLKKTIEGIIKDATGQSPNLDLQQLQASLRTIIKDKKFLLILDDVWSTNRSRWTDLRDLLIGGASGSKIIVTTRDSEIALIMGTYPAHNLKGLSRNDSMALFKKWAFDEKEKEPRPDLLEIGKDIVNKSQGVPLLVKTLGCLLFLNDDDRHWTHIRDSETWALADAKKDILPVLKLSYDHLPSHLKRCFATFSLFPRGYAIDDDHLTSLWMGLGLISSIGEKLASEDVGALYVKELQKRSLVQVVEESESMFQLKLHDLVHSLATIVAENDCSAVGLDATDISETVRCVSIPNTSLEEISNYDGVPPFLRKPTSKRLRAFKLMFRVYDGVITREFVETCISKSIEEASGYNL